MTTITYRYMLLFIRLRWASVFLSKCKLVQIIPLIHYNVTINNFSITSVVQIILQLVRYQLIGAYYLSAVYHFPDTLYFLVLSSISSLFYFFNFPFLDFKPLFNVLIYPKCSNGFSVFIS